MSKYAVVILVGKPLPLLTMYNHRTQSMTTTEPFPRHYCRDFLGICQVDSACVQRKITHGRVFFIGKMNKA